MINEKQEILATVNTLPDNTTWDDAVYTLYLHSKLQKSKDDIKNGRVMSIEESKERMRKNVRGFTIDKGSDGSKGCPGKAEGVKGGSLLQSVHRFR